MAGRQGPEAIEEAVAATLSANLGTYLTAIWNQWGDQATVPLVQPVVFLSGEWDMVPDYPMVYVRALDGQMGGENGDDGAPFWALMNHHLEVGALLRSDSANVLDKQCKRYLWAIWKTLMNYQHLDGSLVGNSGVSLRRYGKSATYPESDDSPLLLKGVAWEVVVWLTETAV